jgi:hypothetical protein
MAKISESEKKKEDWMNSKWRPMMGWSYMITCIADFVVFPVLWSVLQTLQGGQVTVQWNPITLQGAGLYHMAMGAVLGIAAWSRGKEKIAGVAGGPGGSTAAGFSETSVDYQSPRQVQAYAVERDFISVQPTEARIFVSKTGKEGPVPESEPVL